MQIPKSTLDFLKKLSNNNNREWFTENKPKYLKEKENFKSFADALLDKMSFHDHIEKLKLYRIYRDVRFSKDKTPYKNSMSGSMSRASKALRGGYYFHIEPENSFLAGGFWAPNASDLKRIRDEFVYDDKPIRKIIADPVFIETFGTLQGDGVKTAPRGYDKEHPAIDLIRKKQFIVVKKFTDKEVLSKDFLGEVNESFKRMRSFFDYMSEVLTTDANGESIL